MTRCVTASVLIGSAAMAAALGWAPVATAGDVWESSCPISSTGQADAECLDDLMIKCEKTDGSNGFTLDPDGTFHCHDEDGPASSKPTDPGPRPRPDLSDVGPGNSSKETGVAEAIDGGSEPGRVSLRDGSARRV
jgi:hypothetical protein